MAQRLPRGHQNRAGRAFFGAGPGNGHRLGIAGSNRQSSRAIILTEAELRLEERRNTLIALTRVNWKVHGPGGAAELLGIKPTTLVSRIKKLGLKRG